MNPLYYQLIITFLGIIASALVAGAIHLGKKMTRLTSAFEDFPPHRHINGSIIYPKDFEPTEVERLSMRTTHC